MLQFLLTTDEFRVAFDAPLVCHISVVRKNLIRSLGANEQVSQQYGGPNCFDNTSSEPTMDTFLLAVMPGERYNGTYAVLYQFSQAASMNFMRDLLLNQQFSS